MSLILAQRRPKPRMLQMIIIAFFQHLAVIPSAFIVTWTFISGLMTRADPANKVTWKNLSQVSQDPGTVMPGSWLTGLARGVM